MIHAPRASEQIDALRQFILRHERQPQPTDPWHERHFRARAAVLGALDGLHQAHELRDDDPVPFVELAAAIRRWIEGQTFSPRIGTRGLLLLDAAAAALRGRRRHADRRPGRTATGPSDAAQHLLSRRRCSRQLGWPHQSIGCRAARARFQDLLRLPADASRSRPSRSKTTRSCRRRRSLRRSRRRRASSSTVPDRSVAASSTTRRWRSSRWRATAVTGEAAAWLALRERSPPTDRRASTAARPGRAPPPSYAVSRVERYLECPFKYFAAHVLKLPEERDEESADAAGTRLVRPRSVRDVLPRMAASGHGAITANVDEALELFERRGRAASGRAA